MHCTMLRTLLALSACLGLLACDRGAAAVAAAGSETSARTVPAEKTVERLLQRSAERLDKIVAARDDSTLWIEVYGYETPEMKKVMPLTAFLSGKDKFYYDQPIEPKLLLMDGDTAWVESACLWLAGLHPTVGKGGESDLVKEMEMIEVWHWVDGDWYFEGPPRRRVDFFDENPDFLARVKDAREGTESAR